MQGHICVDLTVPAGELREMLIARLAMQGFEGFEEVNESLKAFIPFANFNESIVKSIAREFAIPYSVNEIADENWNQAWESGFRPVIIDDFVAIRADFHQPMNSCGHELIITPKMSFGTGHHATTSLMIRQMKDMDLTGRRVLDFGTGTGILSILAEKMGAESVIAIDHDERSIENATENFRRNQCTQIELLKQDDSSVHGTFDVILANINKNVILDNFSTLAAKLNHDGVLLVSGVLKEDEADTTSIARKFSLIPRKITVENNWLCLRLSR